MRLTEDCFEKYQTGKVVSIAADGVEQAVQKAWLGVFELFEKVVFLVVMMGYSYYVSNSQPYLVLIPLGQLFFDYVIYSIRAGGQYRQSRNAIEVTDRWEQRLVTICDVRFMVNSYKATSPCVNELRRYVADTNNAVWHAAKHQIDTAKMLRWSHSIFICGAFLFGAETFIQGRGDGTDSLLVGSFVALMATIFKFDTVILSTFQILDDLTIGYAYVQKIAGLVNSETKREAYIRHLKKVKEKQQWFNVAAHRMNVSSQIVLHDCQYSFEASGHDTGMTFGPYNLVIQQGQLICFTSPNHIYPHCSGRRTVLKLLGRILFPTEGSVTFPAELRVRYVPSEPLLWHGSLMHNLRFGNMNKDNMHRHTEEEIWAVWSLLGGNPKYLHLPDLDVGTNGCRLGPTDRILVSITRALLSSVDLLLLASTLDPLGEQASIHITRVLRDWVANRGLSILSTEMSVSLGHRKLKTLAYTTKNAYLTKEADLIVQTLPSATPWYKRPLQADPAVVAAEIQAELEGSWA